MRTRRVRRSPYVRAVQARRRAAARALTRLGLLAVSFLLSAATVLPFLAQESQALDPAVLKSVQSGSVTMAAGTTVVTVPITAVDPAKAFLVSGLEEDLGRPGDGAVSGELVNATTLRFVRATGGGSVVIRWHVVEFTSGVSVQRGTTSVFVTPTSVAISAVDPARSFVLTTSHCDGDYWADNDFIRARLTSSTSLELAPTVVDNVATVAWQVVQYNEASVQRGTLSLSAGQANAAVPISAVDTQHAWLITSYRAATSADPPIGERLVRSRVTSATSLQFDRVLTSGSVDIAWVLVEFQDGTEVRHGSEHFNSGEVERDVALTALDPLRAIGAAGYQGTGGRSPYAFDDVPGVAFFTSQLIGPSTLRLRRGATHDSADVGWFVVYWRGHPPVFQQDLTDRSNAEGDLVSLASPAFDLDGDTLAYSATGLPGGLSIDPATGTISGTVSYTAAGGSPYAVVVRVQDPRGLFATDAFTWTITNTNRAPVVTSPADRTDGEGADISLPVVGSDPDGDTLSWSATDLPPGLDIDPATGVISGIILPTAVLGSPYAVVVRAGDPAGSFGTGAFTWIVTGSGAPGGGNTYLVAGIGGAAGGDDLLTVMDRSDIDPATNETPVGTGTGTTFLYGLDQSPANGLVYASNGNRLGVLSAVTGLFTPLGGTFGSGSGPRGTIAFSAVHGIAFDPITGNLYAVHNVVGGDDVLFRVDPATGALVPGAFGGSDYLVIQGEATKRDNYDIAFDPTSGLLYTYASDPGTLGSVRLGTIDLTTGAQDLRSGKLDSLDPMGLAFDAEGNAWGVGSPGSGGRVFLIDKATGKPGFAIAVDDGGQYQAIEIIYHHPPVLDQDLGDRTDAEGTTVSLAAPATDPDGETLTWSATGLPPGVAIAPATGLISGTIAYNAAPGSPYAVTILVEDPGGLSATDTFTWAVTDTNRAPEAADPGAQGAGEGQTVTLGLLGTDADGDALTWSASGLPPGLAIDPASGVISGTVSFDASPASPYGVRVRVTDDGSPSLWDEVSFLWTVADTNRSPVVAPAGDRSDAEGQAVAFAVSASDPDGDNLTWSASGLPPGVAIDPATGTVSGTVSFDASPGSPYAVTVTATDDGSPDLSSGVSFLWVVADTNRAPQVLHPGDQWSAEGEAAAVTPVASDPDGDALTWSAAGLPPGLTIDPASGAISGTLSYEAAASSPFVVTLTVVDDRAPNLTDSVAFNWTVLDTNRVPVVADPGPQQAAEGDSVLLALSGSDPDGDTLTWSATGLPPGLSIDPATGTISGIIGYDGAVGSPHVVAVTAEDDGTPQLSCGVSFLWAAADTNRPPQILDPGSQTSAEGAVASLAMIGSDPDADGLTWSALGLPPGLSIDAANGRIAGTPTFEAAGMYPVTVTATDDGTPSLSSQVTFAWEVAETNRAPDVIDPGAQASAEGQVVDLPMDGFDPDGNDLSWSAVGLPPGLSIDPATGAITGAPGFSSAGTHLVSVRATDDGAPPLAGQVAFSWEVSNTNRAPVVVVPSDRTDPEGAAVALAIAGSDPDGDTLSWSADGLPPGLSIDPATGVVSGVLGFSAADGSPYRVTVAVADDGSPGLMAGGAFTWSIGDVDRAPVLGSLPDRYGEAGDGISITLTASDPDGDPLSWSASGLPPGVSLGSSTGRLSGALSGAGAFTVTVTVTAAGASDTGHFTWMVAAPGAPILEPIPNQLGRVGDEAALTVAAGHPDGDPLIFVAAGLPPGVTIGRDTGLISGTLTTAGFFTVEITVEDPAGASAAATFLWVVELPDLPPVAQDDFVVVGRDQLGDDGLVVVTVLGNDLDPEGEPLTLVSTGTPEWGTADLVDGAVVFHPPEGWIGTVSFPYWVADPMGQEDEAAVTITVRERLDTLLAASTLQWQAPDGAGVAVPSLGSSGTLLTTLVQSLHVLRVPLALLGGAVVWSLLLGGALNLGLALRRGLPSALSRRGRLMAIILAPQGAKIPAYLKPGGPDVAYQYLATDARIKATGRHARAGGREWLEVLGAEGGGWVEAIHLTEHLDKAFFAEDRAPRQVLEQFVDALRRRQPLSDLVSRYGLWVAHHGAPVHYSRERVATLWDDPEVRVWKGRNPAYPDLRGTFDTAVATGVLDAYHHPKMELAPDRTAVPSTVIPVEFTNLHYISIGADLIGPERLDQIAWLVHFSYEDGKPRVIGLCREG